MGDISRSARHEPHCEVIPLSPGEILLNELTICTTKVVESVSEILANVDLTVGVGDFIDDFHDGSFLYFFNFNAIGTAIARYSCLHFLHSM